MKVHLHPAVNLVEASHLRWRLLHWLWWVDHVHKYVCQCFTSCWKKLKVHLTIYPSNMIPCTPAKLFCCLCGQKQILETQMQEACFGLLSYLLVPCSVHWNIHYASHWLILLSVYSREMWSFLNNVEALVCTCYNRFCCCQSVLVLDHQKNGISLCISDCVNKIKNSTGDKVVQKPWPSLPVVYSWSLGLVHTRCKKHI